MSRSAQRVCVLNRAFNMLLQFQQLLVKFFGSVSIYVHLEKNQRSG